jgi:hypothetical protein
MDITNIQAEDTMDISSNNAGSNYIKQDAKSTFYWWFNQAKECELTIRTPWSGNSLYPIQCCLQQTVEFLLKAVIESLTGRIRKSRNPYTLWENALGLMPEISPVFPRDSSIENKLFHFLKPCFLRQRAADYLLPNEAQLTILFTRVQQLQKIMETSFLIKLHSLT